MSANREQVLENLRSIRGEIGEACARSGRDPAEILIVGAAKTVPAETVGWVVEAGVSAVGENYVSELRQKRALIPGVVWHYIGALQTNTARHVAALADVVETVSGERATRRLAGRACDLGRTLDVLIEVDLTGTRAGVGPEELPAFADGVAASEGLNLVGLMTLPPMPVAAEDSRRWFAHLRDLRDRLQAKHPDVLELSMGMSLDYAVAVEEGATMVRIGTALFGPRTP